MLPFYFSASILARYMPKRYDVGIGPEPLINNYYHKMAMEKYGYSVESFACDHYYIIDKFDINLLPDNRMQRILTNLFTPFFLKLIFRYRVIYIYFNGGIFGGSHLLWRIEPLLYRLANVKVVVLPYGSDVQALSRCPTLLFKHAVSIDYPAQKVQDSLICRKIALWTRHADHIVGGCDWVDYMSGWDTLMLAHFSIDTDKIQPSEKLSPLNEVRPLRILHAPNHRAIKGTDYFISAVRELRSEGLDVELTLLERLPNEKILDAICAADLVADQLVVGWYAMFALEAMATGKPVMCFLREDLIRFYTDAGLVAEGEIPIINCTPATVKEVIRKFALNRTSLASIGTKSREYVLKHHSLASIGSVFDRINRNLHIEPRPLSNG